jgi:selenide, water dikinase
MRDFFPEKEYPDVIAGLADPDDAAVLRIAGGRALVFTADFFTPIVDTPYEYGAIAAANALSDVYAMGGEPALALNLFACPPELPPEMAQEIFHGGAEKVRAAGAVLAGGHSIKDRELKYGLAAIGFVDPGAVLRKNGARPGDCLFLSKPLGSGVITTAIQREQADPRHVSEAVEWMMKLNNSIQPWIQTAGIRAATDITGFGLLGHGSEMAERSGVRLKIKYSALPLMSGAHEYSRMGMISGGTRKNSDYFGTKVALPADLPEAESILLFDAQTSGGLLFCVPEARADAIRKDGSFWEIGSVEEGSGIVVER